MGALDRIFRGRRGGQDRPLAAQIAALFASSEQGLWYDPSDLSTMYQDASGATRVYAPGQGQVDPPVGLMLDKRKGLVRGSEMLLNGSFDSGAANWVVLNTDATHVATFSGGTLRFQADTLTPALQVQQVGVMTVGRWYEITVVVSAYVSGSIKTDAVQAGGGGFAIAGGAGTYRTIGVAVSSVFSFTRGTANVDLTIDSISVRELQGNHAFQTTTASRPTLSARYNLLIGSEQLSGSAWSVVSAGSVSLTRTSGYPSPVGDSSAARLDFSSTATGEYCILRQIATVALGVSMRPSIWLRADTPTTAYVRRGDQSGYDAFLVTSEWSQFFPTAGAAASSTHNFDIGLKNSSSGGSPAATIYAWGADLRVANDGVGLPSYQRVVDASTYGTAGFPLYLRFDGVDDFLQTASVDFSTSDKILVSMAMRKFSDATAAVPLELSTVYTNAGAFAVIAPVSNAAPTIAFVSKGASASVTAADSTAVAPISTISTGYSDIGGKVAILRTNGLVKATTVVDQGGGNYGIYPLYIGRRAGTSLPFGGRVYGLLIRAGAANDSQIGRVERYLNQKAKVF